MAPEDHPPPEQADLVLNAQLRSDGHHLQASNITDDRFPVQGMYVHYTTPDVAEAERAFEALCEGDEVEVPEGRSRGLLCSGCASTASGPPGW